MKDLIPKRRFVGFTDPWEQRKLGDVAEFSKGNGYTKNDLIKSGSPIILYGRLYTKYETVINDVDVFVDMKDNSVISEGNEIIVPASGETAEDIARASVVGKPGFILGGDLNIIKSNQEINPIFLALTISNGTQQKEMSKRAQGKSIVHLHNYDLKQVDLFYPKLEEQKKIGDFFIRLDNLITLHQRKHNKLRDLKSAYLNEMFPQEGKLYPRRRFAGFTDPWEQRKLGEVANYRNGKAHENNIDEEGNYVVVNSKFVSTNGKVRKYSNKQNEPLFKNEIAFVLSDVPNGRAIARTFLIENDDKYTLNQRIAGITPLENTYPYFLYILMNRHSYFLQFDDGAKQTNLSKEDVEKFGGFYPDIEEQIKIGTFFENLDNLITLHRKRKIMRLEILCKMCQT